MLFEAEFQNEVNRQLAERQANAGKTIAEVYNAENPHPEPVKPTRFAIEGDDANQTLMWRSLMKDCAFYYDVPTLDHEKSMRRTL